VTTALRGLTWDHPRGYVVLDALATGAGEALPSVRWDRQPLEGFESRPLRTLADAYDLLVIDHPGLGEAVRDGALRPLDDVLTAPELAASADVSAGRSYDSYHLAGKQWALPLDAAAQVSVCRPDLFPERPATWPDACHAARSHRTAVCLGGPHALLMFSAVCAALGAPPAGSPGPRPYADPAAGTQAVSLMADLLAHSDAILACRNPIGVLDAMAGEGGPAYCPLVYGYITYQRSRPGSRPLAAFGAPEGAGGIGSVLGGTGLAVTRSCADLAAARALLLRLVSQDVQVGLYPKLGGQSGDRRAWADPAADASAGGFYSATRATIEAAWVRPRFPGYVEFQAAASAMLRDGLLRGERHRVLVDGVNQLFAMDRRLLRQSTGGQR
jgi:multiple sugar transport system substrate-binding protein